MPDVWLQRKSTRGKWIYDALYMGENAVEVAEGALQHKRDLNPHIEFRIAPPRKEWTKEQDSKDRFRQKQTSTEGRWVMGD